MQHQKDRLLLMKSPNKSRFENLMVMNIKTKIPPLGYRQFIETVRRQCAFETLQEAEALTRAAIETLGELLTAPIRQVVKTDLPPELYQHFVQRPHDEYPLTEFYRRVEARAGISGINTVHCTGLVMALFREFLPDHEVWQMVENILNTFSRFPVKKDISQLL